jgi:hypothetical protein
LFADQRPPSTTVERLWRQPGRVDTTQPLGEGAPVTWERQLLELFEDLEQQAEGAALVARDAEVADLARAEYAEVDLASRCHASEGHQVELTTAQQLVLRGRLVRAGRGWCLLAAGSPPGPGGGEEWLVAQAAVVSWRGLSANARPESVRPVTARLGLGSALRPLAEDRAHVVLVRSDATQHRGEVRRVGKDFLELVTDLGVELVPFDAVAAIRR